jgi:quinol---cytochrome c reductase iron-sulfur subunit, bacillus type
VADDLERPGERADEHREPHLPAPTIWPVGFAVGVALVLLGLIVSWPVAAAGAVLTLVFAFLWIRHATREYRGVPIEEEEEPLSVEEPVPDEGLVAAEEEDVERYPRSRFLEAATLGFGGLIGAIVTLPPLGLAVAPSFVGQAYDEVDLGPLDNYPEGQFVVTTFNAKRSAGGVFRRTAFIRNNGMAEGEPSFTIISNRCVHLGCPTQPQGLSSEPQEVETEAGTVVLAATQPSGFGCPCHGGAYDVEGNRTAGPPVRALDRYEYAIRNSRLVLREPYSVSSVEGEGANARIHAFELRDPGQHVAGPDSNLLARLQGWFFYPYVP